MQITAHNKKGTSQTGRFLKTLNPDYFKVDEKDLDDFIAFVLKYARIIGFYNTNNSLDGDWRGFFDSDVSVLLIQISAISTQRYEDEFESISNGIINNPNYESCKSLFVNAIQFLHRLFHHVQNWNEKTQTILEFNKEIKKLIQFSFSNLLSRLYAFENDAISEELLDKPQKIIRFEQAKDWDLNILAQEPYLFAGEQPIEKIKHAVQYLNSLFFSILSNITLIVNSSKKYLNIQLNDSQNVSPHIALFIAFFRIYRYAQDDINRFTKRHLDYYYKDILHFEMLPEKPDNVHVVFELQPTVEQYMLPAQTALSAGEDREGQPLTYRTTNDVFLNQAKISAAKAVINEKYPITDFSSDDSAFEIEHRLLNQNYIGDFDLDTNQTVGFALSSSILHLSEGIRRITMSIQFHPYTFNWFIKGIKEEHFDNSEITISKLNNLFKNFFVVAYTGGLPEDDETDWFLFDSENVEFYFQKDEYGRLKSEVQLFMMLTPGNVPVRAIESDEFPAAHQHQLPVFQFIVHPNKSYLYNQFKHLEIKEIRIETDVLGLKDLKLQSDYGLIDKTSPYQPFGATPTIGSSFYVGHETAFARPLNELYINFEWFDVPIGDDGFPEYYSGYTGITSNEVFKAKLSILKNKNWIPEDDEQLIELFETIDLEDPTKTPVNNFRGITGIDTERLPIDPKIPVQPTQLYDENTLNGYIKLELCYPPVAFGHKEYPDVMRRFAFENRKKKEQPPLPNQPYIPTLKNMSIDYSTAETIDLTKMQTNSPAFMYHLHPFGKQRIVSGFKNDNIHLIPSYSIGSELYIGLEDVHLPQNISLLFQIDEFASDNISENTRYQWDFLYRNQWHRITDDSILRDTTNNLMQAGIVEFELKTQKANKQNQSKHLTELPLLPTGLFWLRCKSPYGAKFVENIIDIKTQAVLAVFENNSNDLSHIETNLPPERITSFIQPIDGIKEVQQPYASFGGEMPENEEKFYTRISERLRHKNRAITAWDYEHLVLQQFPEVHRLLCLTTTSAQLQIKAGSVLLVVLPGFQLDKEHRAKEPKLTNNKLRQIQEFVQQHTSPFIQVEVRNPVYEQVKVKFNVKFHKGYDNRYYLKVLNEALKKQFSPWLYDEKVMLDFSQDIRGPAILYFLETREYVDFITNFSIYHIVDGKIVNQATAKNNDVVLQPGTPISIFVSAEKHLIGLVEESAGSTGRIEDMVVETDFILDEELMAEYQAEGIENLKVEHNLEIDRQDSSSADKEEYILRINADTNTE